jgi:hydrophobic/amphiphilic exporter-1 (mainly G- bacteria), HAE1 family
MNLSAPFIRRPVMTTLVMTAVLIFGVMAYFRLPVSDLPSIPFPTILVNASNPGMDPETMASNVATPIEQQLMQIEGVQTILSSSNNGQTKIIILFDMDKNIDVASTDVSAALTRAQGNLPPEMPNPPTYRKTNPADAPVMYIAVSSETATLGDLYDYANNGVAQRVSMVSGVSQVQVYGSPRATRVKVNPDKLAAMQLGLNEVTQAIVSSNQSLPAGTVYDQSINYTLDPQGQVLTGPDYDNVIIAERDGHPVYVRDIGKGIDSTADEYYYFRYWDKEKGEKPTIVVAITKQTGYNTVKLCNTIRNMLPEFEKTLPASLSLDVLYDASIAINESIGDVKFTLVLAFILVVFVIFFFLGNMSTTIIPSASLPMSIIGTFAIMYLAGFSIDILSMMGLTLVVGFLVDDAIVVLENIVRHMEMGKKPFEAALAGSGQISSTVLSMTLALSAVFIPVIFMPGTVGNLFHEFGKVVVIAVLLSGMISLTLTPMLCSLFLKPSKNSKIEQFANKIMAVLVGWYMPALRWVLEHRWVPIVGAVVSFAAALWLFTAIPQDFLPAGDTGAIRGLTVAAQNVSLHSMANLQNNLTNALKKNPYIQNIISVANLPEVEPGNQGVIFISLVDIGKRPSIDTVMKEINEITQDVIGIHAYLTPIPQINLSVGTGVEQASYSYVLSTMQDPETMYKSAEDLMKKLKELPELADVSSDMQIMSPMLNVNMLRDQAGSFGITVKDIETAFSEGYSGARVSTYNTPLNIYNIVVEMEDDSKLNPDALKKIRLRSQDPEAELIPLESVADWNITTGPISVNHSDQATSATIFFNLAPGAAMGTAINKVQETADETLPSGILRTFQGEAQMFEGTMGGMSLLLVIGVLVIYLLLGSLYESFIHPLTILSTLPGALFGGLITLLVFGGTLSLYAYVGMIVLIGIVMKNGIMLVEFSIEEIERGKTPVEAALSSAEVRFRPILMTTVAAAMGAVPIAIGIGADAASRRPLGLVILGGLLFAQFITYFFTPIVYIYLQNLQDRLKKTE